MVSLLGMSSIFSGCNKDDDKDSRDQYIGSYKETAIGTLSVIIDGQQYSIPQDFSGTYQISKGSGTNSLIKLEGTKSLNGVFTDPTVIFDPEIVSMQSGNESMQLTVSMTGTFSSNIFITTRTITGTYFYMGASYPVSGTITGNATKL